MAETRTFLRLSCLVAPPPTRTPEPAHAEGAASLASCPAPVKEQETSGIKQQLLVKRWVRTARPPSEFNAGGDEKLAAGCLQLAALRNVPDLAEAGAATGANENNDGFVARPLVFQGARSQVWDRPIRGSTK